MTQSYKQQASKILDHLQADTIIAFNESNEPVTKRYIPSQLEALAQLNQLHDADMAEAQTKELKARIMGGFNYAQEEWDLMVNAGMLTQYDIDRLAQLQPPEEKK